MANKEQQTVTQVTELLTKSNTEWYPYVIRISPVIREIIEQSAQDVNVSVSTIVNIYLARAIVSIDNDET